MSVISVEIAHGLLCAEVINDNGVKNRIVEVDLEDCNMKIAVEAAISLW